MNTTKSHGAEKKTMKQQKKKLYMFIHELIFIHCDKIIDSNEHGTFFLLFICFDSQAAPLIRLNLFFFGFLAQHFETKERQTDGAVMMSLYGTGCRTEKHKNAAEQKATS